MIPGKSIKVSIVSSLNNYAYNFICKLVEYELLASASSVEKAIQRTIFWNDACWDFLDLPSTRDDAHRAWKLKRK